MDIILLLLIIFIPLMAQLYVSSNYNKYSKTNNRCNKNGYEVAREILDKHNLKDMYIVETSGNLTDHYDPKRKIIRLSKTIYNNNSIASIAVAAHEVGHAIQDKEKYTFFRIRTFLFPIINFTSSIAYITIIIGFIFEMINLLYLGFGFVFLGILFQALNLPLEFNASSRAKKELKKLHVLTKEDEQGISSMLNAAAFTYVAGMLASILQLLRIILIFGDNN